MPRVALFDTVDYVLEPGPDVRALVPVVDDLQGVVQQQKHTLNSPILIGTGSVRTYQHSEYPRAEGDDQSRGQSGLSNSS